MIKDHNRDLFCGERRNTMTDIDQKQNIKTLCIFNDIEDLELALKHDPYAYQIFLNYSDEELQGAINHYYDEEFVLARDEAKQNNFEGEYGVRLKLKSYKYLRKKEDFNSIIIRALKDYGVEVKTIISEKL